GVCEYRFRYGTAVNYIAESYTYTDWAGAVTTGGGFLEAVSGLTANTKYMFACIAKNSAGEGSWSDVGKFVTADPVSPPPPPPPPEPPEPEIVSTGYDVRIEKQEQIYQYYVTGYDNTTSIYDATWGVQTITPSIAHQITRLNLLTRRYGEPGTITISIQETTDGEPNGNELCSGTTDGNTLPDGVGVEWRNISLGVGAFLEVGTQYAIVVSAADGDVNNALQWRVDSTEATYSGGCMGRSTDSGSSWSMYCGNGNVSDFMFAEYGPSGTYQYMLAQDENRKF
ncbi:unnamed protein product, partial [marine sediment metagenome]